MSWLLRDGDVLAAVEDKHKGWDLSQMQGALLVRRPTVVHTLIAGVALDVAWCAPNDSKSPDSDQTGPGYRVRRIAWVPPRRVAAPYLGRGILLVAAGGAFERWGLQVGDCLEVRGQ